jgi:hypothetical protein
MSFDNLSLGFGGTSRFSGQRGRTADGMGRSGVRYPSPFFDLGHTYLPPSQKKLLHWCRYYYLVNPLINSVIHKMSEYPITEIVIDEKNVKVKEKWEELLGTHLRYRPFQIEVGLDYYTYGMCVVTIHFPFTKWLICRNCKHKHKAKKTAYKWRNLDYVISCDKCGTMAPAKVQDFYERDLRRIRLMRWNPEYVNVEPGFAGSDPIYTFELPLQTKNDVLLGKKTTLDSIPDVFIEAMRRGKFVRFADENVFVLKRPIISQKDEGWGMPLIFPVLKDTFYLQILRKAQEAIAQEHIVPLRVLFPQAGSQTSDPYSTINLDSWKGRIEGEIAKWKYDNNYIPILPLPIGNETIGGDGKALMLHQEMEAWSNQIVAGMGVPREFVFGGLTYSGSNVSMRMLENSFIGYRVDHESMLNNFIIRRIAHFMGWPVIKAHMRRFKMADDLQRTAFYFQLNQAQKISDQTLLQESDMDPGVEDERKKLELDRQIDYNRKVQVANAEIQAEVTSIQQKAQLKVQQEAMAAQGGAVDPATGQPVQDPNAAASGGQQDPNAAMPGAQAGQEGEMQQGAQAVPGMPANSTVSAANAQQAPEEGIPQEMQSPLTMGQTGGGMNLLYLARRAVAAIHESEKTDPTGHSKTTALSSMKMANPQLYRLVIQLLQREQGSQADPLNATQSPLPKQKPERRASHVGV